MSSNVAFDVAFSQIASYMINDLLLGIEDGNLCNFADHNRLYTCCESLNDAKFLIESLCSLITDWFKDNFMKMNPEKCQVIILGEKTIPKSFSVEIDNILRKPVPEVTVLDNKLNFNSHTSKIFNVSVTSSWVHPHGNPQEIVFKRANPPGQFFV